VGQKSSRNHSAGSTHSNFYPTYKDTANKEVDADSSDTPTRAEFNEFRAEVLRRLAKLEEKILKLEAGGGGGDDRQQHF
jgi:hypothetical protein